MLQFSVAILTMERVVPRSIQSTDAALHSGRGKKIESRLNYTRFDLGWRGRRVKPSVLRTDAANDNTWGRRH